MNRALALLSFVPFLALTACRTAPTPPSPEPATATGSTGPAATAVATTAPPASKGVAVGSPAPDFALTDLDGKTVKLSDYRGKTVVLEWFNPECPFVKANHGSGSLKEMAKRVTASGVVWLAINSGAPGKQGHGVETNKAGKAKYGMEHPILLDETGATGRAYGAKATPHMFVVDKAGVVVYRGAIDNAPDGDPRGSDKVVNYVELALADLAAGRPVAKAETDAYGCSVKYAAK